MCVGLHFSFHLVDLGDQTQICVSFVTSVCSHCAILLALVLRLFHPACFISNCFVNFSIQLQRWGCFAQARVSSSQKLPCLPHGLSSLTFLAEHVLEEVGDHRRQL